eukprot:TRINITY_DN27983_c0_g1_i1.p2 TRINITY_DN27983_c0_g1~~TRINITY_DN27983_c0_g1_i1.p2  ORF type:complete len:104 (+),score=32.54 TRINITY_DN27983_c0_g1_i1:272-583(+)
MQEEIEIIKSNIYLPPEDDYVMEVDEEELDKEDEEMREMLALIENAKGELDTTKEEELLKMMDRLDDDEYFEKLKVMLLLRNRQNSMQKSKETWRIKELLKLK